MKNTRRQFCLGALSGMALVLHPQANAQEKYPTRTVTVIVPTAVGTEVDWLAREYAEGLAKLWGVGVIVENKVGAGGDIGTGLVARAPADGHTLLFTGGSFAINPVLSKTSYDPVKSFTPILHAGGSHFVLAVSQKLGVDTVAGFVQLAKSKPGALNYGSPGTGSVQHLGMELFKREAGLDIKHIPFKGAATAINDLAGGFVDALLVSAPQVMDLEKGGRLKILMTISPKRDPRIPSVPTAAEAGFKDLRVDAWSGIMAPAGTPAAIVKKINADLLAVRTMPSFQEDVIKRFGTRDKLDGPGREEELAAAIRTDLARWKRIVDAAGIRRD
jgi:tripartite-type tricarboxylate transporter receptor subunit TctC